MIFAIAMLPSLGKMAGGSALLPVLDAANRTESETSMNGLAAMAKHNNEMAAKMRQ